MVIRGLCPRSNQLPSTLIEALYTKRLASLAPLLYNEIEKKIEESRGNGACLPDT